MDVAERPRASALSMLAPLRVIAAVRSAGGVLYVLLLTASAAEICAFAATGFLRALYPYTIDTGEPGGLQQVTRVLAGQPLYTTPTLDYVPLIYGPVYYYLAAPLAAISGSALFGLRASSLLASLGSIALLTLIVRRETGSLGMGLVGGALLAACDQLVEGAMDIGRTDATMLFFLMAAIYACRQTSLEPTAGWRSATVGGTLMGLALLTKQSSVGVGVAIIVVLAAIRRDQLAAFVLALALTFGAGLGLLVLQSGHWPIVYLWELPRLHQVLPQYVWRMWGDVATRFATPALVAPFYLMACLHRGDRKRLLFYMLIPGAMICIAWASQATIGGTRVVELPVYAAFAILAALSLHEVVRWIGSASHVTRMARGYVFAAAVGQLVVLLYNPRLVIPLRSDMWAGDRLATRLATLPGPIFAGAYQSYVRGLPDAVAPDLGAVVEILGAQSRPITPEGHQWSDDLARALMSRRFTYVIVNPDIDGFIVPQLASDYGYKDVGPLFPPSDVYWSWKTSWAPRAEVYVRPDGGQ